MKVLFTADWHISERHGFGGANHLVTDPATGRTETRSLNDIRRACDALVFEVARRGVDLVVHLGDVFDRAQPSPAENALALQTFERLAQHTGERVLVVQGNHDRTAHHDALVVLEKAGNAIAFRAPDVWDAGPGARLYFVPYPPPGARLSSSATSKEDRNRETNQALAMILADLANDARDFNGFTMFGAHLTFAGTQFGPNQSVAVHDVQAPTPPLEAFDFARSGHIHLRQRIGAASWYTGPLNRWSFGDARNECGADIVDTDTGEVTRVDLTRSAVQFATFTPDEVFADFPERAEGEAAVARVVGEVDSPADFDAIAARIDQVADHFLGIRNDVTIRKHVAELAGDDLDSLDAIFGAFVESRPDAIADDLREDVLAESKRLHAKVTGGAS